MYRVVWCPYHALTSVEMQHAGQLSTLMAEPPALATEMELARPIVDAFTFRIHSILMPTRLPQ